MSKVNYNSEIMTVIDSILLQNPLVVRGKMFGYPAYYINKKLFACIYEEGVGIKVTETLAKSLIGKEDIFYFQPLGRHKMREWIQINRKNPKAYLRDMDIFQESINFVASTIQRKTGGD
jgi:hypothetical protein